MGKEAPTMAEFQEALLGGQSQAQSGSRGLLSRMNRGVSAKEKRRRRFIGDERLYSVRNKWKRQMADGLSYVFQSSSYGSGAYLIYALAFGWTWVNMIVSITAVIALVALEVITRSTSDTFWDHRALNHFSIRFAILNFVVIWSFNVALSLGGVYFLANDTAAGPGGSVVTNDPGYLAMVEELKSAKAAVESAKADRNAFFNDENNKTYDAKAGNRILKYKLTDTGIAYEDAIIDARAAVTAISKRMTDMYGVIGEVDKDTIAHWLIKKKAQVFAALGLQFLFMLLFEVCMWYRSVYDFQKMSEELYRDRYGVDPPVENSLLGKLNPHSLTPVEGRSGVTSKTKARRKSAEEIKRFPRTAEPLNKALKTVEKPLNPELSGFNGFEREVVPPPPPGTHYCGNPECWEAIERTNKKYCNTDCKNRANYLKNKRA